MRILPECRAFKRLILETLVEFQASRLNVSGGAYDLLFYAECNQEEHARYAPYRELRERRERVPGETTFE